MTVYRAYEGGITISNIDPYDPIIKVIMDNLSDRACLHSGVWNFESAIDLLIVLKDMQKIIDKVEEEKANE